MTTVIRQDIEGDIVVWTMDHPTKSTNTIDQTFLDDLEACIERLKSDPALKGAVVTSAKQLFLAGADLNDIEKNAEAMSKLRRRSRKAGSTRPCDCSPITLPAMSL